MKKVVTQEDLDKKPDLVEQGVEIGDEIEIPETEEEGESKTEDGPGPGAPPPPPTKP